MSRSILQQSAWNAGELSPRLHGRSDFPKFSAGSKLLENVLIHPAGGFQKRSGTRYVFDCWDASKASTLVPFKFSNDDAYVLEFAESVIRIYRNGGVVTVTSRTFAGNTNPPIDAAADTIQIPSHFFHTGQGPFRLTDGGGGLPAGLSAVTDYYTRRFASDPVNKITLHPTRADALAGTSTVNITGFGGAGPHTIAAKPATTVPAGVTSTYLESELIEMEYAQSADVMYLAHKAHPLATLTRISHSEWILGDHTFIDGPFLPLNTTTTTVSTPALAAGASGGLTSSAALFTSADVGRQIRVNTTGSFWASNWQWATITAFTSSTSVTVRAGDNGLAANTTTQWRLGYFYQNNYPRCVCVFEQRLVLGGEPAYPETVHLSVTGNYNVFADDGFYGTYAGAAAGTPVKTDGSVSASNALNLSFGASDVQAIRFLATSKNLIAGTVGGIWPVRGSQEDPLTPTNPNTRKTSAYGAALRQPVQIDDATVHVSRERRRLRALAYAFQNDAYGSTDLNRLAEHIGVQSQFRQVAFQQEPDSTVWVAREDGVLAALTLQREENVLAWGRHWFGGSYGAGRAVVESVAAIPSQNSDSDQVWVAVKRTVNSATVRYIELMDPRFDEGMALEDFFGVDSGVTSGGAFKQAITAITLANPAVVSVASTSGLSNGDRIRIRGVSGVNDSAGNSLVNGKYFLVANVAAGTFELQDLSSVNYSTSGGSAYVSGGTAQRTVTSITGLTWLEGQTVVMNADGSYQTGTVSGGAVTVSPPAASVQVGLAYTSLWESLPLQLDDQGGSGQGRLLRPPVAVLRLLRSTHLKIGRATADLDAIPEVEASSAPTSTASVLFSGDVRVTLPGGWERGQGLVLSHAYPFPWAQVSAMVVAESGGG